jgi:hypothetical protein
LSGRTQTLLCLCQLANAFGSGDNDEEADRDSKCSVGLHVRTSYKRMQSSTV